MLGGTRFMGKHMVKELISKGHNVTIATRGMAQDDFGSAVKRLVVDRSDERCLKEATSKEVYDLVFESLAYCSNDIKIRMNAINFKRYIQISSASVYADLHMNTKEDEFDVSQKKLVWCNRKDFIYDEIKRQAECSIVQAYPQLSSVMIRFPYIIGTDDYTKRLYFYVDHIINQKPIYIDNYEAKLSFVRSDERGKFAASFAENSFSGAVHGANEGVISIKEIADYIELKTGKSILLSAKGEVAPYNESTDFYLNTDKPKGLGFSFTPLKQRIYELLDYYIVEAIL